MRKLIDFMRIILKGVRSQYVKVNLLRKMR